MEFRLGLLRVDGLPATRVIGSQPCSIRACSLARAFSAGCLDFCAQVGRIACTFGLCRRAEVWANFAVIVATHLRAPFVIECESRPPKASAPR